MTNNKRGSRVGGVCVVALALSVMLTSCGVTLPFTQRLSWQSTEKAEDIKQEDVSPLAIQWIPHDFPDRIDIQGASGFVGGGSRTRIPTGIALTTRIKEVLNESIGLRKDAERVLIITVLKAQTKFRYGFMTTGISYGWCTFKARFELRENTWTQEFVAIRDRSVKAPSTTFRLEAVWDEIALQVGRSVLANLAKKGDASS